MFWSSSVVLAIVLQFDDYKQNLSALASKLTQGSCSAISVIIESTVLSVIKNFVCKLKTTHFHPLVLHLLRSHERSKILIYLQTFFPRTSLKTVPQAFVGVEFAQAQNEIFLTDVNVTELCVELMIIRELNV